MDRLLTLLLLLILTGCGSGVRTSSVVDTAPLPLAPFSTCVTFIGDSITANWPMENLTNFDGGCYIDHGRGGTTMLQVLDGIDDPNIGWDATVDPSTSLVAVVGGDIYNSLNRGYSVGQIEGWYNLTLLKLRLLGVRPVLCTLLPSGNAAYNVQVVTLNAWIRAKATADLPVADLYSTALVQADGSPNPIYYQPDLVHPLVTSYTQFTALIEQAIAQVRAARV